MNDEESLIDIDFRYWIIEIVLPGIVAHLKEGNKTCEVSIPCRFHHEYFYQKMEQVLNNFWDSFTSFVYWNKIKIYF